jgi:hypothetical protein
MVVAVKDEPGRTGVMTTLSTHPTHLTVLLNYAVVAALSDASSGLIPVAEMHMGG